MRVLTLCLILFSSAPGLRAHPRFIYAADSSPVDVEHLEIGKEYIIDVYIYYSLDNNHEVWRTRNMDSLFLLLKNHPCWYAEIGRHTDCRASFRHNDSTSQVQAQDMVDSMVAHGIPKEIAKGYGERHLLNNCGCEPNDAGPGKDCTEAEHQLNRRYTLKLLSIHQDCH
jgi:hypothetical protein